MIKIIAKDESHPDSLSLSLGGFCCADLACDYRKFVSAVCFLLKEGSDDVMQLNSRRFTSKMRRLLMLQSYLDGI